MTEMKLEDLKLKSPTEMLSFAEEHGVETPVVRADSVYRAVPLKAGDHDVELYFDSSSFKRGALLSLAGMVVIIVLLVWRPIIRTRVQG